MDCSTQAGASSIPASNIAGIFSATAWCRVLFRAFASSGAAFSPQRCRVQPSAVPCSALGDLTFRPRHVCEFRAAELQECCQAER